MTATSEPNPLTMGTAEAAALMGVQGRTVARIAGMHYLGMADRENIYDRAGILALHAARLAHVCPFCGSHVHSSKHITCGAVACALKQKNLRTMERNNERRWVTTTRTAHDWFNPVPAPDYAGRDVITEAWRATARSAPGDRMRLTAVAAGCNIATVLMTLRAVGEAETQ